MVDTKRKQQKQTETNIILTDHALGFTYGMLGDDETIISDVGIRSFCHVFIRTYLTGNNATDLCRRGGISLRLDGSRIVDRDRGIVDGWG